MQEQYLADETGESVWKEEMKGSEKQENYSTKWLEPPAPTGG